jgi:hypothetical protein
VERLLLHFELPREYHRPLNPAFDFIISFDSLSRYDDPTLVRSSWKRVDQGEVSGRFP